MRYSVGHGWTSWLSTGGPTCQGRGPPVRRAAGANKPALFAPAVLFTIPAVVIHAAFVIARLVPAPAFPFRSPTMFSLLGVIGITLVLFVVVALTAGLVLGK
jgi:hypothetical protein